MMLVSSSGWAHSPMTSIFTAPAAVYRSAADAVVADSRQRPKAKAATTPKRFTCSPLEKPDRLGNARVP
jgi:hypothetical protein